PHDRRRRLARAGRLLDVLHRLPTQRVPVAELAGARRAADHRDERRRPAQGARRQRRARLRALIVMLLEEQVVVITGAGPGLGATLARRCAEEGADVVVAARTKATLDAIVKEVEAAGRRGVAAPTDVVDREQM